MAFIWAAASVVATSSLAAQPQKRPGSVGKHVAQKPPAAKPAAPKAGPKKGAPKSKKPPESKKASKKAGSEPLEASAAARASIAGQTITPDTTESSELKELREVEDLLFWDLERPASNTPVATGPATPGPEVVSSGLPPTTEIETASVADDGQGLRWMAELVKPDLPFHWDVRLIRYLEYFKNTPRGRSFVVNLLKRVGRYETKIREALRAAKLPEDLVYLALAESGMNSRIVSHAGAAGLWQFMPKAGEAYGLRIDKWVDERLDPERSTKAAVRFLKDLHTRFGRWELAMAAYNMGHGGLLSSIRKYNTNDFWELSQVEAGIPYETALYVPKIVALAFVAHNREVFGCGDLQLDTPEPFDSAPAKTPAVVSAAAPKPKPEKASPAPAAAPAVEPKIETVPYILRWGESLEYVAASLGTTESKLRALNNLKDPTPPRPGTTIAVPTGRRSSALDRPVAVIPARTVAPSGTERVFYEVVWGDSVEDVARVLSVSTDDLCQWNNIDRSARLHGKMIVQAFVNKAAMRSDVRVTNAADITILVAGTPEFFDYFEAKNGRTRQTISVSKGDTLRSLAKKYGISVGMLERINHRSRDAELFAGESLVVYSRRSGAAPANVAASPALTKEPAAVAQGPATTQSATTQSAPVPPLLIELEDRSDRPDDAATTAD